MPYKVTKYKIKKEWLTFRPKWPVLDDNKLHNDVLIKLISMITDD